MASTFTPMGTPEEIATGRRLLAQSRLGRTLPSGPTIPVSPAGVAKVGPATFGGETTEGILKRIRAANPQGVAAVSETIPATPLKSAARGIGRIAGRIAAPAAVLTELALPAEASAAADLPSIQPPAGSDAPYRITTPMGMQPSFAPALMASRETPNVLGLSAVSPALSTMPTSDANMPAEQQGRTISGFRRIPGVENGFTNLASDQEVRDAMAPGRGFRSAVSATGVEGNKATAEDEAERDYQYNRLMAMRGEGGGSDSDLTTAGQLGGMSLRSGGLGGLAAIQGAAGLAREARGIRKARVAEEQTAVEMAEKQRQFELEQGVREGQLSVNQANAEIAAGNQRLAEMKGRLDLLKGMRELNAPAEAPTVKNILSGGEEESYVWTDQGFQPFKVVQAQKALSSNPQAVAQARDALAAQPNNRDLILRKLATDLGTDVATLEAAFPK